MTGPKLFSITALALLLGACTGMTDTQQRTLTGGLGGTAGGALIGAMAGNAGMGAVIGAGVGLAGGYLYDQHEKAKQTSYEKGVRDAQATRTQ